ncbi:MAG: EAL domain-containing protein [Cellulomonas sp.]|nr:EAL domain-containing protein [Cellulomonas sp.]
MSVNLSAGNLVDDTLPAQIELTIDRSFVMSMAGDRSNALIVRSVVDLGHALGPTLVAEGVDNEEILARLADLSCDVAQSYHLSRPAPAAAIDAGCADRQLAASRAPGGPLGPLDTTGQGAADLPEIPRQAVRSSSRR